MTPRSGSVLVTETMEEEGEEERGKEGRGENKILGGKWMRNRRRRRKTGKGVTRTDGVGGRGEV